MTIKIVFLVGSRLDPMFSNKSTFTIAVLPYIYQEKVFLGLSQPTFTSEARSVLHRINIEDEIILPETRVLKDVVDSCQYYNLVVEMPHYIKLNRKAPDTYNKLKKLIEFLNVVTKDPNEVTAAK